jgi:hypothetical protein
VQTEGKAYNKKCSWSAKIVIYSEIWLTGRQCEGSSGAAALLDTGRPALRDANLFNRFQFVQGNLRVAWLSGSLALPHTYSSNRVRWPELRSDKGASPQAKYVTLQRPPRHQAANTACTRDRHDVRCRMTTAYTAKRS